MKEKEYLSEEKYQATNKKVKLGGVIVMIIGLLMVVGGLIFIKVPEMGEQNWFEASTTRTMLTSFGAFLIIVGAMIRFFIANAREINAYTAAQQMPIAKEVTEKMAPSAKVAAKEITKGIKEGLEEADK